MHHRGELHQVNKMIKRHLFSLIAFVLSLLNLSCFDMYSGVLDNTGNNFNLDIFLTTMTTNNYVITATPDMSLSQRTVFYGNSTGYAGALADFNKDGKLDMLTIAPDAGHMIAFSDGRGNISGYFDFSTLTGNDHAAKGVIADLDNDGDVDVFIATDGTIANKIYLNNGDGTFTNGPTWSFTALNYSDLCTSDLNGDGIPDIILFSGGTGITYIYLGNGDGSFTAGTSIGSSNDSAFTAAGDLDNDGDIDFIQATYDSGSSPVLIYLNNGNATFQITSSATFTAASIALGDVDNDGDLDAYIGTDDGNDLSFLINDGHGHFTAVPHSNAVVSAIATVAMADIDADGDLDLVTNQAGILRIYINDGDLSFKRYKDYPIGTITSISAGRIIR